MGRLRARKADRQDLFPGPRRQEIHFHTGHSLCRYDGKVHLVIAWYDPRQKKIMLQIDDGPPVSQGLSGPVNVGNAPLGVGGSAPNGRGWIGTIAAVGFAKTA